MFWLCFTGRCCAFRLFFFLWASPSSFRPLIAPAGSCTVDVRYPAILFYLQCTVASFPRGCFSATTRCISRLRCTCTIPCIFLPLPEPLVQGEDFCSCETRKRDALKVQAFASPPPCSCVSIDCTALVGWRRWLTRRAIEDHHRSAALRCHPKEEGRVALRVVLVLNCFFREASVVRCAV